MIAITAVMVMAMEAKPFAYEKNNDGTPFLSFKSNPHTAHPTTGYAFSVAPLHSPMTGSLVTRMRTNSKDYLPFADELMSSGSEYSSVIAQASSSRISRPRREGEADPSDPFGGETIDDVDNPLQPGTPVGDGTWFLLIMACGYMLYIVRKRWLKVPECDM